MTYTKELRKAITRHGTRILSEDEVTGLLDRLEKAEHLDATRIDMYNAVRAERDAHKAALEEWLQKTEWVQQGVNEGTISAKYLGLHRADVMTSLLGEAEKERDALRAKIAEMEKTWLSPEGYHILMQEREDTLFQAEKMKQRAPCKDISMWPAHHTQPTQLAPCATKSLKHGEN